MTITVTDVDEDPSIAADATAAISFAEVTADAPGDITVALATYTAPDPEDETISWSKSGRDAREVQHLAGWRAHFRCRPRLRVSRRLERGQCLRSHGGGHDPGRNSDDLDVRVKVTNVAETGTIEFSSLSPKVGVALMATLDDPDGDVTGLMWRWSKGVDDIEDETSDTYTPVADDIGDMLTVTATYRDGSLAADAAAITLPSSATVDVVADTDNKAPVFPDQDTDMAGLQTDQDRMIAENTRSGMEIGGPVAATDVATAADGMTTPETLTYTLGGADAASFSIGRGTGQLSTKADLDYRDEAVLHGDGHGDRPRWPQCDRYGDHHDHRRGRSAGDHEGPPTQTLPPNSQTPKTALGAWRKTPWRARTSTTRWRQPTLTATP